jgi:hypothetical protein
MLLRDVTEYMSWDILYSMAISVILFFFFETANNIKASTLTSIGEQKECLQTRKNKNTKTSNQTQNKRAGRKVKKQQHL